MTRLLKCFSAIEGFVTSCRQLIENGPSASTLIEDAHAAAVQLSETIQSLGSGKSNSEPPIPKGVRYNVTSYNKNDECIVSHIMLYNIYYDIAIIQCYTIFQGLSHVSF